MANPGELLLLAAHMAREIPGDRQIITDERLLAALTGKERLRQAEYREMLASPLTLSRLRLLASQSLSELQRSPALMNHESDGMMPTPELLCEELTLVTNDGNWALLIKLDQDSQRWHLTLQLLASREAMHVREDGEIFVHDAQQGTFLFGGLDGNGQLHAVWELPVKPLVYLVGKGKTWTVYHH